MATVSRASDLLCRRLTDKLSRLSLQTRAVVARRPFASSVVRVAQPPLQLTASTTPLLPLPVASSLLPNHQGSTVRSFSKRSKERHKRKQQRKKAAQAAAAKKEEGDEVSDDEEEDDEFKGVALQHQEWVKFQRSVAVDGFETGQSVNVQAGAVADGGKASTSTARRKSRSLMALEEKLAERQRLTLAGGGQFPPMRYSEEETERLLAQAYAAIPPRAGKRGTRNLKRQNRRWFLVRQIRKKEKWQQKMAKIRKGEKIKAYKQSIYDMLAAAPGLRQEDRDYQASSYAVWLERMESGASKEEGDSEESGKKTIQELD